MTPLRAAASASVLMSRYRGRAMDARMPRITITMISSISVKPCRSRCIRLAPSQLRQSIYYYKYIKWMRTLFREEVHIPDDWWHGRKKRAPLGRPLPNDERRAYLPPAVV